MQTKYKPNQLSVDEILILTNSLKLNSEDYSNNLKKSHLAVVSQIILDGGDTKLFSEMMKLKIMVNRGMDTSEYDYFNPTFDKNFDVDKWLFERKNGSGSWSKEMWRRRDIYQQNIAELKNIEEAKDRAENFNVDKLTHKMITREAVESLIAINEERQAALDAIEQAGYRIVNEDDIVDYVQPNLHRIREKLLEAGFHVINDELIDPLGETILPDDEFALGTEAEIGTKPGDKSVHFGLGMSDFYQQLDEKIEIINEKYYEKILNPYGALPKASQLNPIEYFKERDAIVEEWHETRESLIMLSSKVKYKQIEKTFSLHNETLENIIGTIPEEEYMTEEEENEKHNKFRFENLHSSTIEHMEKNKMDMDELDLPFQYELTQAKLKRDPQLQSIHSTNPLHEIIDNSNQQTNSIGVKPGYSFEEIEEAARGLQNEIETFFSSRHMRSLEEMIEAYESLNNNPLLEMNPNIERRYIEIETQLQNFRAEYNNVYDKAVTLIKGGSEILDEISIKGVKETFKDNFQQFLDIMEDEAYGNSHTVAFFKLVDEFHKTVDVQKLVETTKQLFEEIPIENDSYAESSLNRNERTNKKKSLWNQFKDFIESDVVQEVGEFFEENFGKIETLVSLTTGVNIEFIKVGYDYGKEIYHFADKVFDEDYGYIAQFNNEKNETLRGNEEKLKEELEFKTISKIRG